MTKHKPTTNWQVLYFVRCVGIGKPRSYELASALLRPMCTVLSHYKTRPFECIELTNAQHLFHSWRWQALPFFSSPKRDGVKSGLGAIRSYLRDLRQKWLSYQEIKNMRLCLCLHFCKGA